MLITVILKFEELAVELPGSLQNTDSLQPPVVHSVSEVPKNYIWKAWSDAYFRYFYNFEHHCLASPALQWQFPFLIYRQAFPVA